MAARPITRAVSQKPHVPDDADPLGVTDEDRDESRTYIRWLFEQRLHRETKEKKYVRPPPVALGPVLEGSRRDPKPLGENRRKPAAKKPVAKPAAPQYWAQGLSLSQTGGSYVTILDVPEPAPKVTSAILKAKREAERN